MVTVDCGAGAYGAIDAAGDVGLEVVVIDHHLMADNAPAASGKPMPAMPIRETTALTEPA